MEVRHVNQPINQLIHVEKFKRNLEYLLQGIPHKMPPKKSTNRHISTSRNDNPILEKVPGRTFKPILFVLD